MPSLLYYGCVERFRVVKTTSGYMHFINSNGRMTFLVPALYNADRLFALVITPRLYLHHVEAVNQDPASDRL